MSIYSLKGDDVLVPLFRHDATQDIAASAKEGRPIFQDVEVCDIHIPGSRNFGTYPALSRSHWMTDPYTGQNAEVTYAERFSDQYKQFKAKLTQTKRGTPLTDAPFMTEARRAEMRAMNIYTVEGLAAVDGQELKNLGPGGRDMKNFAMEYLDQSKRGAADTQLKAELEAMQARMQIMEEDNAILKSKIATGEAQFEQMTVDGLRAYITANSDAPPLGSMNRKTLIRMALECSSKQERAA